MNSDKNNYNRKHPYRSHDCASRSYKTRLVALVSNRHDNPYREEIKRIRRRIFQSRFRKRNVEDVAHKSS